MQVHTMLYVFHFLRISYICIPWEINKCIQSEDDFKDGLKDDLKDDLIYTDRRWLSITTAWWKGIHSTDAINDWYYFS